MKKTSTSSKLFVIFNYVFLSVLSLLCLLPFVHLLAVSFSSSPAVSAGQVTFIPIDFTLSSYEFAMRGGKFMAAMWQSVKLVFLGTLVNLIMMILTAYPLSKRKDELLGRNIYMTFFVITMIVSGGMIPTYLTVVNVGLKDSLLALILPGALPVYNMVILMNFVRSLPIELQEAAKIDGASEIEVLFKIVLPLLKPALATVGLFCIVGHWNNWFGGIIYLNDTAKYPLATYLRSLLVDMESIIRNSNGNYTEIISQMNARTGRAAQLFMGMIPVLLVYPFLQNYFTTGLTLGSVKG